MSRRRWQKDPFVDVPFYGCRGTLSSLSFGWFRSGRLGLRLVSTSGNGEVTETTNGRFSFVFQDVSRPVSGLVKVYPVLPS